MKRFVFCIRYKDVSSVTKKISYLRDVVLTALSKIFQMLWKHLLFGKSFFQSLMGLFLCKWRKTIWPNLPSEKNESLPLFSCCPIIALYPYALQICALAYSFQMGAAFFIVSMIIPFYKIVFPSLQTTTAFHICNAKYCMIWHILDRNKSYHVVQDFSHDSA